MSHQKQIILLLSLTLVFGSVSLSAQNQEKEEQHLYQITEITNVPHTAVNNQGSSGTCWCFAGIGLVEAEILRLYDKSFNLSEMFTVRNAWTEKVNRYVRMHGYSPLSQGGEVCDVLYMIDKYGMMPESDYTGMVIGEKHHAHNEMNDVISAYANAVLKCGNGKLTPVWQDVLPGILDTYLGEVPESFTVDGKKYTAQSFAQAYPIHPENYIEIASFTHVAFDKPFIVEIPDNWTWTSAYNLPLDDLMASLDHALENGYTVGWAQDVSDKGFSRKEGVGIVPDDDIDKLKAEHPEKYAGMTDREIKDKLYAFEEVVAEKAITPEEHQKAYDNWETTDDHSMLIVGIAKDQNGTKYYKVKNSWGTENMGYDGYWFCSESYVRLHTVFFTLHKEALPKGTAKRLGF